MNRWIALAVSCLLSLLSFASQAVTLQALPGSTPQTTCFSCVFPNPVGVIALDDTGAPLAGVAVTFTALPDSITGINYIGMVRFDDFCCVAFDDVTVTTGANGVATATPITIFQTASSGVVTASAAGAADVSFQLSSNTQRATTVAVVSGNEQTAQTGTAFAAPWKVRVLDAAGHPVANAMVTFYAGGFASSQSTASFNGNAWTNAVADSNGIATSPVATAGTIGTDSGFVDASLKTGVDGEAAPDVPIEFHVVSFPLTTKRATLVSAPPPSLTTGTFAATPYVVRLTDASGHPAVGMPVVFMTDCGSEFDGAAEQTVVSDAKGLATSALLEASVPAMCNIYINPAGLGTGIVTQMHVYDPNNVVVTPRTPWVVSHARHTYRVIVDFTESGLPIQPASLNGFGTIPNPPNGPAGITGTPTVAINGSSATITALANKYSGLYDLQIFYWTAMPTLVHVLQLP